MKVSIVIPTYERVGFVESAIRSVLDQDHPDVELLVLDDGSTDGTAELLERIARTEDPERFRWAWHENIGQAATINRGFEQLSGELLGYLSSDDLLSPGAISRLVAEAEAHPEADVLYPCYRIVDGADQELDLITPVQHTWVEAVRRMVCLPGVGALVRRRLYERIGGWDPSYRFSPDFDWWLRARDAVFRLVDADLGLWRLHGGSITKNLDLDTARERLRLLEQVFAGPDLPEELLAVKREAYATLFVTIGIELGISEVADPRYEIRDALSVQISKLAADTSVRHAAVLEREVRKITREVHAADAAIARLDATVAAKDALLAERERRIAGLEAQLTQRPVTPPAPVEPRRTASDTWRAAARTLVPPALRPRIGAAAHRVWPRR